jgi:hypothetical protein
MKTATNTKTRRMESRFSLVPVGLSTYTEEDSCKIFAVTTVRKKIPEDTTAVMSGLKFLTIIPMIIRRISETTYLKTFSVFVRDILNLLAIALDTGFDMNLTAIYTAASRVIIIQIMGSIRI